MEGLQNYLLNEINNTFNNVHRNQLAGFLEEIELFIQSAWDEVEETLLADGIVVPMEEYNKVVKQLIS